MSGDVEIVHWNPRDSRLPGRVGQALTLAPRKNNFGDLLGPLVVALILKRYGIARERRAKQGARRLLTVGSILHLAKEGDVVWGTGVNGKATRDRYRFTNLDVRAVRGPLTLKFLAELGLDAPAVFGDPALLLPELHPDLRTWSREKQFKLSVIPNLNEVSKYLGHPDFLSPRQPIEVVLKRIAQSERVVGSSLHAIIVAESLGIPASLIQSAGEPLFKYEDYFAGTGRRGVHPFATLEDALVRAPRASELDWSAPALLSAFPRDLWADDGPSQHGSTLKSYREKR